MVKCCIVGCTSGYKSNKEVVSQFCVPKDPLRNKWIKAISRLDFKICKNTYVCEKHFNEHEIVRYWISGSVKCAAAGQQLFTRFSRRSSNRRPSTRAKQPDVPLQLPFVARATRRRSPLQPQSKAPPHHRYSRQARPTASRRHYLATRELILNTITAVSGLSFTDAVVRTPNRHHRHHRRHSSSSSHRTTSTPLPRSTNGSSSCGFRSRRSCYHLLNSVCATTGTTERHGCEYGIFRI